MSSSFFPNRGVYWSFWANILFIIGMIGYLVMDVLDYMRPTALNESLSSIIYVVLAGIFVVNAGFQLLSLSGTSSSAHRYYFMFFSYIFDKFGSVSYLFGAFLTAITYKNTDLIWTFTTMGVFGFAIGAVINMFVRGTSLFYSWANILNMIASLLYVLAVFVTITTLAQYIIIGSDVIYLIDAILYMICWFSDRQVASAQNEHIGLVQK